jgi:hypothetical protein
VFVYLLQYGSKAAAEEAMEALLSVFAPPTAPSLTVSAACIVISIMCAQYGSKAAAEEAMEAHKDKSRKSELQTVRR